MAHSCKWRKTLAIYCSAAKRSTETKWGQTQFKNKEDGITY
jgi:hypothetical protein